jgi:small neutral amino acid transporter SnatA (MarC family)
LAGAETQLLRKLFALVVAALAAEMIYSGFKGKL